MSELKATPGPWQTFNMVGESGETMTPDEIGEYVKNAVLKGDLSRFLFVAQPGEGFDICHVGNGPSGPYNAHLIAAAPDGYALAELVMDICGNPKGISEARQDELYEAALQYAKKARGEP